MLTVIKLQKIVHIIIFSLIIALSVNSLAAQTVKRMDTETWNAINAEVSAEYTANSLKGISVAVVYGGQIAYANAFGDKNNAGDPFTINTKSLLASISKTITGVLAMKLVENNDINLGDPISDYVPGYNNSGITIRHLLSHQSGIAHYSDCPNGYNGPFNASSSSLVVLGCSLCVSPPGAATLYTSFGTTLLGVIINNVGLDVYDMDYEELYYAWIHNPGGLGTLEPEYNNLDPFLAQGSANSGYWSDIGWRLPAGGFKSDIIDLANYTRGLLNNTFITQATFNTMKILQTTTGTPDWECSSASSSDYGLAFRVSSNNPSDLNFFVWHNGLNSHGYSSYMIVYPNRNAAIVMMTNTDDATGVLNTIRQNIEDLVLCPNTRNFTNNISWTEPRIFEGEKITGQSEITSSNTNSYIFDAEDWVKLLPGFKAPAGKVFRAIVTDGCGGNILTD